jgi:hypothetical protein
MTPLHFLLIKLNALCSTGFHFEQCRKYREELLPHLQNC